jgi:GNAT superfamily N-acetyltransferase
VTAAAWRAAYGNFVSREKLAQLPIERWRHEIGVGLRRPVDDAFTYVAEIDEAFAGYCYVAAPSLEPDVGPDVAELVAMYVDPDRWGQGAGNALMAAALERLAGLPYAEVVLWTFKENAPTIAFYQHHGWRPDGTEKIHPRTGNPAVRYRRPVTMPAR